MLQALRPAQTKSIRPPKRRKLDNGDAATNARIRTSQNYEAASTDEVGVDDPVAAELVEDAVDTASEVEGADSDDEDFLLNDPFERHYVEVTEPSLSSNVEEKEKGSSTTEKTVVGKDIGKSNTIYKTQSQLSDMKRNRRDLRLKKRLSEAGTAVVKDLKNEELDMMYEILNYKDILCGFRTSRNAASLINVAALHSLNHVFKTRDKILKNNAKIAQDSNTDGDAEYRDQGFTRPKVLVIVPTKQACVRFVDSIVRISQPDQQENKGRFMDSFSFSEDDTFENKPDDFRELFGGNHEEDFRVGLKFTRKTIKFFSGFYNSDIIIASPLGLMRTITTGGGKKESKAVHDADFLSSIEIAIMDHAAAIEMQNWQHVDYVFSQLNLLPKDSHGCDFARVRTWYLDGKAKYLRQTIILSAYLTPQISSLASAHLHNIAGRFKYMPLYSGAMLDLSPSVPFTLIQSFLRFDSVSPQSDSDGRFKFFISAILPGFLRSSNKTSNRGTLIFVPTYLDFVRLRNHLSMAAETSSLSFATISEYSSRGDVARARSHFLNGRSSLLLYTERAHHYFRYKIRGIRRLIFYGVPENPLFWSEMLDGLGQNALSDLDWGQTQKGKQSKGLVRALFSKWDMMKLERIVGTERVGRLVREKEGDVFDFV